MSQSRGEERPFTVSQAAQPHMDHRTVSFPALCLAYCRPLGHPFGFLLVTDFTDLSEGMFMNNKLPEPFRNTREFKIGNKSIDPLKVFSVNVLSEREIQCWLYLKQHYKLLEMYSLQSGDSFAHEGIICVITMKVQRFNGKIEGFFSHIKACTRESLQNTKSTLPMSCDYTGFLRRYVRYVDDDFVQQLKKRYPIEHFFSHEERIVVDSQPPRKRQNEASREPQKRLQAKGAFKQHLLQPTDGTQEPMERLATPVSSSSEESKSPKRYTAYSEYHTNTVSLHTLAKLHPSAVRGCHFETLCRIKQVCPEATQLFVKPFRRTFKVAGFRLILVQAAAVVSVELHEEEDVCHFFGVDEVEELLENIDGCARALQNICGKQRTVRVAARAIEFDSGYTMPYWGCDSTLKEMQHA